MSGTVIAAKFVINVFLVTAAKTTKLASTLDNVMTCFQVSKTPIFNSLTKVSFNKICTIEHSTFQLLETWF